MLRGFYKGVSIDLDIRFECIVHANTHIWLIDVEITAASFILMSIPIVIAQVFDGGTPTLRDSPLS